MAVLAVLLDSLYARVVSSRSMYVKHFPFTNPKTFLHLLTLQNLFPSEHVCIFGPYLLYFQTFGYLEILLPEVVVWREV